MATTTSAANADLVRRLGADVVIDYREDDFATVLHDYDVVLHSLDDETLKKSLSVLKPEDGSSRSPVRRTPPSRGRSAGRGSCGR